MSGSDAKYHLVSLVQRFVLNPPVHLAWRLGVPPPGDAQLETIGRHTGRPQRTAICNGLVGTTFWVIAQHGRRTEYVRNLEANPRVRIRTGAGEWRPGTAHVLPDDDPRARRRELSRVGIWRWACLIASQALSTDPLSIRIDLDSAD